MTEIPLVVIHEIADSIGCDDEEKRAYFVRGIRSIEGLAQSERSARLPEPPFSIDRDLQKIVAAVDRFLDVMGFSGGEGESNPKEIKTARGLVLFHVAKQIKPSRPEDPLHSGEAKRKLDNDLAAVRRICDAAEGAREDLKRYRRPGRGGPRHEKDRALKEVVWHLVRLYCEVTGREAGTSVHRSTREAGGPTVRFVGSCLPQLGWEAKSDHAVRALIREALADPDPLTW